MYNKEKTKIYYQNYHKKHRKEQNIKSKNYRKENKERLKIYDKKRYNDSKRLGICVDCHKNPCKFKRTRCCLCAWKQVAYDIKLTLNILDKLYDKQNGLCALSGRKLIKGVNASPDHIVPRNKGGTNDKNNLRLLDWNINRARSDFSDEEFIKICIDVTSQLNKGETHAKRSKVVRRRKRIPYWNPTDLWGQTP